MLEDKIFFEREITHSVTKLVDEAKFMNEHRIPVKDIYHYILINARDYNERYMALFLFGMIYKWFKDDNNIK
jgi:hypothetical protein